MHNFSTEKHLICIYCCESWHVTPYDKVLNLHFDLKAEDPITTALKGLNSTVCFSRFQAKRWPTLEGTRFLAPFSCFMASGWWWNTTSSTTGGRGSPKGDKSRLLSLRKWSTSKEDFKSSLPLWVGHLSRPSWDTWTCCSIAWFCAMCCGCRHYGWAVCGGRPPRPPLQQGGDFLGQADELAAQHHVSVLWHFRNSNDRLCFIQKRASRSGPTYRLLGPFCWRWTRSTSWILFQTIIKRPTDAAVCDLSSYSRVSVLFPRAQPETSGRSHPHPAAGGCVRGLGQLRAGGVHQKQLYSGADPGGPVHPAGLVVLPGETTNQPVLFPLNRF